MGQPPKKTSRASHKARKGNSDYTYDDLVNTAGFEHMFSFLRTRHPDAPGKAGELTTELPSNLTGAPIPGAPTIGAQVLHGGIASEAKAYIDAPLLTAPSISAPIVAAPSITAPVTDADQSQQAVVEPAAVPSPALVPSSPLIFSAPSIGALNQDSPPIDAFDLTVPGIVYDRSRYPARPTRTAQDGHTIGEQELYEALWKRSAQVAAYARAITIGERTIARELFQTPRSYSSVQENLRSLAAKLAIDIRLGRPNAPKTYLIYSYEETLRRRRQAGLTHYRKRASAVDLVNGETSGALTLDALKPLSG